MAKKKISEAKLEALAHEALEDAGQCDTCGTLCPSDWKYCADDHCDQAEDLANE